MMFDEDPQLDSSVLGRTTGSHLGLPDAEEAAEALIWLAECVEDRAVEWRLVPDTPETRARFGFT